MIAAALRSYLASHPACAAAGGRIAPQIGAETKRGASVPLQVVFVQAGASDEQLGALDEVNSEALDGGDTLTSTFQFNVIGPDYDDVDNLAKGVLKALRYLAGAEVGDPAIRVISTNLDTVYDDYDEQNGLHTKFISFQISHEI